MPNKRTPKGRTTLQFKLARSVNANRPFDPAPMFATMAGAWDETMTALMARYGSLVHQR